MLVCHQYNPPRLVDFLNAAGAHMPRCVCPTYLRDTTVPPSLDEREPLVGRDFNREWLLSIRQVLVVTTSGRPPVVVAMLRR